MGASHCRFSLRRRLKICRWRQRQVRSRLRCTSSSMGHSVTFRAAPMPTRFPYSAAAFLRGSVTQRALRSNRRRPPFTNAAFRSITRRYQPHIHCAVTSTSVQIRNVRSLNLPQAAPKLSVSGFGFTPGATSARLSSRHAPRPRSARPMTRSSGASLRSGTDSRRIRASGAAVGATGLPALSAPDQPPPLFVTTCNAACAQGRLFVRRNLPRFNPCANIPQHDGERASHVGCPGLNGTRQSCSFFPAAVCFPSQSGPTGIARGSRAERAAP